MSKKRITITSIAKELNLTPATVSRALNDKHDISVETKRKVMSIANKRGYINNLVANSLRSGFTMLIGVVCDNIVNPYYAIMTTFISEYLKEHGYLPITFTSPDGVLDSDIFKAILSRNVDGVISFLEPTEDVAHAAKANGTPLVLLGRTSRYEDIDAVCTDDYKGGKLAAEHLMSKGCKDILFVSEHYDISCVRERFAGFKDTLEKHGLFKSELTIFYDGEPIHNKLEKFIELGRKFDGVFCFNDILALETLSVFHEHDIKDFKLVGFDYIQDNIKIPNQLTTVAFDKQKMARVVVDTIISQIDKTKDPNHKIGKIDVKLIQGKTT